MGLLGLLDKIFGTKDPEFEKWCAEQDVKDAADKREFAKIDRLFAEANEAMADLDNYDIDGRMRKADEDVARMIAEEARKER